MVKRIFYICFLSCLLLCSFATRSNAQDSDELAGLITRLMPSGQGDDAQIRAAVADITFQASKSNQPELKARVAKEFCLALNNVAEDEVKNFLLTQLQQVAGDESVGTAKAFLLNPSLCVPAVYVILQINSEASYQAMFEVFGSAMKTGYRFDQPHAVEAYFVWLHHLNRTGSQDYVANTCKQLIKKLKSPQQTIARCSALELYSLSVGEKALSEILDALKDSDIQYREAALTYSLNIRSVTVNKELLKRAKAALPDVKAQIIRFLGENGDSSLFPSLLEFLHTGNETVLTTTIDAVGRLGKEQAIIPIIEAMNNSGTPVVAEAGKKALLSIDTKRVLKEAVNAIPQVDVQAKIALIDLLAQKQATAYNRIIFKSLSSNDQLERRAAYTALKGVVTKDDTEELASLFTLSLDTSEIVAVQEALYASVSQIDDRDQQTEALLNLMNKAERKELYFRSLALVGGKRSLEIVSESLRSKNADIRKAASEALMDWNGMEIASVLFSIAEAQNSGKFFNEALMEYVSKVSSLEINSTQKLLLLRKAMDIAVRVKQKQDILEQITRTGTFTALMLTGKYLNDSNSEIRCAAAQAAISIALNHKEYYGKEVTALLHKAIEVNSGIGAELQKQTVRKHLTELPEENGFVSLFNGKDLTGWKGLVENPLARSKMKPSVLAEKQKKANDIMRSNWKADNGLLVYYGKGFDNLCTEKQYGDFELYIDWKIGRKGDAGVYLRGSPQVQIWDTASTGVGAQVGSGGLYNNQRHTSAPLIVADNPVGEWNTFHILITGEFVTVYLNGQLVTDHVVLENYWDRNHPIFPIEQIELQAHGSRIEYRDIYIREIQQIKQ